MKSHATYLSTMLVIIGLAASHAARATDPYTDGWIGHVNGRQLDICYRVTPLPAVGTKLQVMRVAYVIPNKGIPSEQFASGGQATVTAIVDPRCVRAELTEGAARRADHVRGVR